MIIIPVLKTCEEQINYIFRFDAKIEVGKVYKATEFKNFCCRDIDPLGSMLMTDVATNESWIMPPPIRQNQTGDILWEEKNGVCIGKTEEQIKAIWQEHLSDIGRMEDTSNTASIGERVKEFTKEKGLKQQDVAAALCITPSYMSRIEAGKVVPSDQLIHAFCSIFHVNEKWIKTGEGGMAQSGVKGCASNQESAAETDNFNSLCAKVDMLIAAIDRLADGRLETPTKKGLLARLKRKMQGVTEIMTPCSGSEEDER